MDQEQIVAQLMRLGLEEDEAQAYVHLYLRGPCRAGDIADAMGVHQTKGYWAMNHLVNKGFADALPSQPKRYKARPPAEIAQTMVDQRRQRIERIEEIGRSLERPLEDLRRENRNKVPSDTFRMIHGRAEVLDVVSDAFERMDDELVVFSINPWAHMTPENYGPLWELGIDKARDGVDTQAIFHTTQEMRETLEPVVELDTVDVRHMDPERRRPFIVVDGEEIFYWLVTDPSESDDAEGEVVVWSNSRDLVDEHLELFHALREKAIDVAALRDRDVGETVVDPDV